MSAQRPRNVRVVRVLVCECAWRVCGAYAKVRGSVFMRVARGALVGAHTHIALYLVIILLYKIFFGKVRSFV